MKQKLFIISTVSISLESLLKGQLASLKQYFEVVGIASGKEELQVVKDREGIRTIEISMHRQINLWGDLKSLVQLYLFFKNEKPVIVHSITPKAGLLSMIAAKFAGVPIRMHTFTGLIFPSRKGFLHWLLKNMDRITCAFATHIVPEGEGVKRDLISYRLTYKVLKVIGNGNVNGIDTTYFSRSAITESVLKQINNTWHINPHDFVYIFIGRLVKDKGINELIEAFINVNEQYPQTKLLLVGDYEQKLDPLHQVTKDVIKNHPHIIYTGFQSDIRPYLVISDVLTFPSYREGFPNVVMQAGAMELPSIVTNINGCNEIIQENVNGMIIPIKDAHALENAMIELLENKEKRKRLAQNARAIIVEKYEQKMVWQLIKQEYDEQLKKANLIA